MSLALPTRILTTRRMKHAIVFPARNNIARSQNQSTWNCSSSCLEKTIIHHYSVNVKLEEELGFEPRSFESKSKVLPLNDSSKNWPGQRELNPHLHLERVKSYPFRRWLVGDPTEN